MIYKTVRTAALAHWLNETSRIRGINDDYNASLECTWQVNLVPEDKHNSLFCSIAEWSTNLTDLLEEISYDKLKYDNEEHRQKLFRQYTRILLVTSEILTDFRDLITYLSKSSGNYHQMNKASARAMSSSQIGFSCGMMFDYINNVCKHKIGNRPSRLIKYHVCNHHIDYSFKDVPGFITIKNSLKITNVKTKKIKEHMVIEVPTLEEIINQILAGYNAVDRALNRKGAKKHVRIQLSSFETDLKDE